LKAKHIKTALIIGFVLLAVLLAFVSMLFGGALGGGLPLAEATFSGLGTAQNPYSISTVTAWNDFVLRYRTGALPNFATISPTNKIYIQLTDNLDFSGRTFYPFTTFNNSEINGNHHAVVNAEVNSLGAHAGFFFEVGASSVIQNIGFFGGNVVANGGVAGGIAAQNAGKILNSFSTANVRAASLAGGVAAQNMGEIENVYFAGGIAVENADATVGGLVGQSTGGAVRNSYSLATIGGGNAGGIFGAVSATVAQNLYFSSDNFVGNGVYGVAVFSNVTALTNAQFGGRTVADFGFNATVWARSFSSNDFSADYAPSISGFLQNAGSYAQFSVIIRRFGILDNTVLSGWGTTAANPFVLTTAACFIYLSNIVNGVGIPQGFSYIDRFFVLGGDVDFGGAQQSAGFNPIGTVGEGMELQRPFRGTLDGRFYTISNLVIEGRATRRIALFGFLDANSVVKNLRFDDTVFMTGNHHVATVAAHANRAIIENIETRATLNGDEVGGIATNILNTTMRDCLSFVKLLSTQPNPALFGVVRQSSLSTLTNVWYATDSQNLFDAEPANLQANRLVGDINGTFSANLAQNGSVEVEAFAHEALADIGFFTEFRRRGEDLIARANVYTAPTNSVGTEVYIRFVRQVVANEPFSADPFNPSGTLMLRPATGSGTVQSANYYEGQIVTAIVEVNSGFILRGLSARGVGGENLAIPSLSLVHNIVPNASFQQLTARFEAPFGLAAVSADIGELNFDPITYLPSEYNGTPVEINRNPIAGDNLTFTFTFFAGSANLGDRPPSNAGNYVLRVLVQQLGVVRGGVEFNFTINPRELEIAENMVTLTKEWDNSVGPTATAFNHSLLWATGSVILADRDFLQVVPSLTFGSSMPAENLDVTVTFALSGTASLNYRVPSGIASLGMPSTNGAIVPRTVLARYQSQNIPEILNQTFTGAPLGGFRTLEFVPGSAPLNVQGIMSGFDIISIVFHRFNTVSEQYDIPVAADQIINAGRYRLQLTSRNPVNYVLRFHNAEFNTPAEQQFYYLTVDPKPVEIEFLNLTNFTFNNSAQNVTALSHQLGTAVTVSATEMRYQFIGSNTVCQGGEFTAGSFINAGNYLVKVVLNNPNFVACPKLSAVYPALATMQKANQTQPFLFTIDGSFNWGDGDIELVLNSGETGDPSGTLTFRVVGNGEIKFYDDKTWLSLTGGGEIEVFVKNSGSANFNAREVSYVINVGKGALTIGLSKTHFEFNYGEVINLTNYFTFKNSDGAVDRPAGFTQPTFWLDGALYNSANRFLEVDTYSVTFGTGLNWDAYSHGYTFSTAELLALNITLVIRPRPIIVRVDDVTKTYGEALLPNSALTFRVYCAKTGALLTADDVGTRLDIALQWAGNRNANATGYVITHVGTQHEFFAKNANFEFVGFENGRYFINRAELVVEMFNHLNPSQPWLTRNFLAQNPTLTSAHFRVLSTLFFDDEFDFGAFVLSITHPNAGANAFNQGSSDPFGKHMYGFSLVNLTAVLGVSHTIIANYNITFNAIELRVLPIAPTVTPRGTAPLTTVDSVQYVVVDIPNGMHVGIATPSLASLFNANVGGRYIWDNSAFIPNFLNQQFVIVPITYRAEGNLNYTEVRFSVALRAIPLDITATLNLPTSQRYNGESVQIDINSFTFRNALNPQTVIDAGALGLVEWTLFNFDTGAFVTEIINVGNYRINLTINNTAFALVGSTAANNQSAVFSLEITKAPLSVGFAQTMHQGGAISFVQGSPPALTFTASAAVLSMGQHTIVLQNGAAVDIRNLEAGTYTASPWVAGDAANYQITLVPSVFRITKTVVASQDNTFTINSSTPMAGDTQVEVNRVIGETFSSTNQTYLLARNALGLRNMNLNSAYELSFSGANAPTVNEGRVSMRLPDGVLAADNPKVIFVLDGVVTVAQNVNIRGGMIEFDLAEHDFFGIVSARQTQTGSNLTVLYVGLGIGGGIVLIIVLAVIVNAKRKKNQTEYSELNSRYK
jgi:hypothetical protein